MPSVSTRRTRLSYSTELEQARMAPIETPIERVQDSVVLNLQKRSASKLWNQKNTLENIRMTPFGHERTDYTYGDSGSYRLDRVTTDWKTPDMSRLPLHHAERHITTLGSDILNGMDREMESRISEKKLTVSRGETDYTEHIEDDEISSRGSLASSRSSSRISRVRCKRVQGEWCVHADCIETTPGNRRMSMLAVAHHQRNMNNTSDFTFSIDPSDRETPHGRLRHKQQHSTQQRRSTRMSTRSSISAMATTPQNHTDSNHSPDRSNLLASASSTYVYTYVPTDAEHVRGEGKTLLTSFESGDGPELHDRIWDSHSTQGTTNDKTKVAHRFDRSNRTLHENKTQTWLTRHIFGLESSTANSSNQFIPSDVEESDTITDSRAFGRRQSSQALGFTRDRRSYQLDTSPNQYCGSLVRGAETLKQLTFTSLAFVLAGIYVTYDALTSCIRHSYSSFRNFLHKSSTSFTEDARGKLSVHPRLTKFDVRSSPRISSTEESDFFGRTLRKGATWASKAGSLCCRLIGCLCFLIPLLFLLAFLFAPVAVNDKEPPPVWPSFLSDTECKQALLESLPSDSNVWQLARWRLRCLYHLYLLTPDLSENITESDSSSSWQTLKSWFWETAPIPSIPPVDDASVRDDRDLVAQLAAFAEVVNRRLDLLTKTVGHTAEHVSKLEQATEMRFTGLNAQLDSLKQQFNKHSDELESWRVQLQALQALAVHLNTSDPSQTTVNEYDRLFHAVISAANQTIARELRLLRIELNDTTMSLWNQHNGTIYHLSIILSHLRQQLFYRFRRMDHKLAELRTHVHKGLHSHSVNHSSLVASMDEIRTTVDTVSERLAQLRRADGELDALIKKLQEATRDCSERLLHQVEHCKQAATERAELAVAAFSERLVEQIAPLVKEALMSELNDLSVDATLNSKLSEMVQHSTREAVERAIRDASTTGLIFDHGHTAVQEPDSNARLYIQRLIDSSLDRFAADRVGLADFALESAGGAIVGTRCTRTYTERAALFTIFGIPLARLSNSARTILQPGTNPGDCWAFHGSKGQAVVRLSQPIVVTSVSLEHLPRILSPNQKIDSAPRDFLIKGLTSETDEGIELGHFTYDSEGPSIQTFPIKNQTAVWQLIEFEVLSNHGHPLYTCVYRLRVHGKLSEN